MPSNMKFIDISMSPLAISVRATDGSKPVGEARIFKGLPQSLTYAEKLMARPEMKEAKVFLNGGDVTHLMGDGWKDYV